MFKKILVALDHSEISHSVFEEALNLAKISGANLMLAHVLSSLAEDYPAPIYPIGSIYPTLYDQSLRAYAQQAEQAEQQGENLLRSLATKATQAGVPTEFTQNLGNAGATLCHLAKNWGADLIMLGRRGHKGLSEFLLGSVSNYVLHHASCSVLVVQGIAVPVATSSQSAEAPGSPASSAV
jgi:nucleotide-binding universal stress UspA family protein